MRTGTFSANGSSEPWLVLNGSRVHLSLNKTFGGGTVTVHKALEDGGELFPVYDGTTAVSATAPQDIELSIGAGWRVIITLSGATAPDLVYSLSQIR